MLGVLLLSVVVWLFDGGRPVGDPARRRSGHWLSRHELDPRRRQPQHTILPSPPGFVGTMQFAYVIAVQAFGYSSSQGIVAATANQIFLIGSMVAVGLVLLARGADQDHPGQPPAPV